MNKKTIVGVMIAIMIIAIGGYFFPQSKTVFQSVDNKLDEATNGILGAIGTRFPNGVGIGTTSPTVAGTLVIGGGSTIARINYGTCNLTAGNGNGQTTIAASTTQMHYCAASGVQPGDRVWVQFPSALVANASSSILTGAGLNGSLQIVGATATTSNVIGIAIYNGTGAATTSYSAATTGVQWLNFR